MARRDTILPLESEEARHLIEELRASQSTVLVGSGISCFAPTSLPAGQPLGQAIAKRLLAGSASDPLLLGKILENTAFEHVMERCPDHERARQVFSRFFCDVPPNEVHSAIARLAGMGVVRHIVTPNYDVGFERAFGGEHPSVELALVRGPTEAPNVSSIPDHVLFKIHGCATPEFSRGMVFRLTDEAQLENWKRDTLRVLIADRPLVVIAYSGMDFEICPELPRMGATRLVWLHLGELKKMTANAWRVVRGTGGVVLLGSAQALLGRLLGEEPIRAEWSPREPGKLVDALFAEFDSSELDTWRARLFGEIGCARDAIAVAERLLAAAEADTDEAAVGRALGHRARGRFHHGDYLDAAADYARAVAIFQRLDDPSDLRGALNGVAESNRCAGRFGRAYLARRKLAKLSSVTVGRERESSRVDGRMLRMLKRRHTYLLVSLLPRGRRIRRLRNRARAVLRSQAKGDIAAVAEFAATAGNWLQLQQTKLWAKRYRLRWGSVFHGTMDPLPPKEGYRQLGYVVAQSMAVRDERTAPDLSEMQELLYALVGVEAWPEAWKLARYVEHHLGPTAIPTELWQPLQEGWSGCQYTGPMRWAREKGIF